MQKGPAAPASASVTSCLSCLMRCDGNTDRRQCGKSPAPKPPNIRGILYSYISYAGTSSRESFILATPGKVFAPFCLSGGSCRRQGCRRQCSAVMLSGDARQRWSSAVCTAHPELDGAEGSQGCSWHRRSSVGQLYHFPEVHAGLLVLLGRIQSARCDK